MISIHHTPLHRRGVHTRGNLPGRRAEAAGYAERCGINLGHERICVVLDTETTGLYPETGDEIIELAAEKLVNKKVVDTFHAFMCPSRPVPEDAVAIHGLDNLFLKKHGEEAAKVIPRFARFIEEAVLVGHNIRRFDYCFLAAHFARLNLSSPANDILDTLELARAALSLPNYKLSTVAAHFDISTAGAHRAMADVVMAREVLLKLWPATIPGRH